MLCSILTVLLPISCCLLPGTELCVTWVSAPTALFGITPWLHSPQHFNCSSQPTLGLNPSTNHRNNLFQDSALLPQALFFPEMACPYVCSHDGFPCAVRMWGSRFRPRGIETIFLFLMLEKNEPVGSVHAKSFSCCQSQTFLPGTLLHLFPGVVKVSP